LNILGVFAQFETQLRRERQLEGIARAKKEGVYKGRRRSIDQQEVIRLLKPAQEGGAGLGPTEVAKQLGISRGSVYRLQKDAPGRATQDETIATSAKAP
jgi:DNA invertase Pin-like site-specific DNA recombinase